MFAPGYVAGWALDLFEFRRRRQILRLILAVPLSISICPMLSYLLARFLEPVLWAFYIVVFAACVLLLAKEARRAKLRPVSKCIFSKYIWVALSLMALWGVAALGSMVDLQIGDKLCPPEQSFLCQCSGAFALSLLVVAVLQPAHEVVPFVAAIRGVFRRRLVRTGLDVRDRARPEVPGVGPNGHRAKNFARGWPALCHRPGYLADPLP
jgi:TctA family transporter